MAPGGPPRPKADPEGESADPSFDVNPEVLQQLTADGNTQLIEALRKSLGKLVGTSSGYIESLPVPVQRRIDFLRQVEKEREILEEALEEEIEALEAKYAALKVPLDRQMRAVIQGREEAPANLTDEGKDEAAQGDAPAGIPHFWLTVLRNSEYLDPLIQEKDAEVLEYLTDISCEKVVGAEDSDSFTLIFTFAENPFFTNRALKKSYYMSDSEDLVLEKITSDRIAWKPGKDVTVKVLKKKQRPGQKGKPATKVQPVDSFFHWFDPPQMPEDTDDMEEEEVAALQEEVDDDFVIAELIHERILEHPVAYFTGDAVESEDEEDDEDEDDDEDDDEEYDDDEDSFDDSDDGGGDHDRGREQARPAGARRGAAGDERPQECKQQ